MAHDDVCETAHHSPIWITELLQMYDGPISESVPSSVTGFAHRRPRSDSVATFTYFQSDDESPKWSEDEAVVDDSDSITNGGKKSDSAYGYDLESRPPSPHRRKSSSYSRASAEDALLLRRGSSRSDASMFARGARKNQKMYVVSEDLTIVVAGFSTRTLGFAIYILLCTATLGLGYLLLRWLPRWRVRLVGSSKPLSECDWVVIEVRCGI